MRLPQELTTVTAVSRVLGIISFILFPFIGFGLGIRYQEKIIYTHRAVEAVHYGNEPEIQVSTTPLQENIVVTPSVHM